MRLLIAALLSIGAPAAAQTESDAMTAQIPLPPPPVAAQRPYSYERHGVTHRGPLALAEGRVLPDRRRRGRARLSARRERLFRSGDGAAPGADRDPVRRRCAAASPRTTARSRSATATFSTGGRSSPARNIATWYRRPVGRRRRSRLIFDEAAEAAGKQYFRLGAIAGQPRRPLRRDPGRRRRLRAVQAAHPRPRHRPGHRDRHRGRHRLAGLDRRQPRHRLHRGQRPLAQLPRPPTTGSASPPPSDRTLYEETENIAFTVGVGRTQDRRCILISTGENSSNESPHRPRRQSRGAAGADRPAPAD